ncbi:hypothetical protein ACJJTC_001673 [Scirpophaga incertulas]
MIRFVMLSSLVDTADIDSFPVNVVQDLKQAILFPVRIKPAIQQALQRTNFKFHRPCSYSNLIQEYNEGESEALLMFWASHKSESRFTLVSHMSTSSNSSTHVPSRHPDRELRSTPQQTDISCRTSGLMSPALVSTCGTDELCARIAGSLTHSSATSSLLHANHGSVSFLDSVCALLLNKQGSPSVVSPKLVDNETAERDAVVEGDICRICFGGESAERLVRPCACRGTVAAVHRACLERWLLQASASHCELCRYHYRVTRSHKCGWAAAAAGWAASGRGRALWADAARGAALGAAGVAATARALAAADRVLQAGARRGGSAALAANLLSSVIIGVIGTCTVTL